MSEALTIGQTAPDLTLPVSGGGTLSLSALRGKKSSCISTPRT